MTVEFGLDNELMQLLMKTRCEELLVVISFGHMVLDLTGMILALGPHGQV